MEQVLARRRGVSRGIACVEAVAVREASHDRCHQAPRDSGFCSNEEDARCAPLSIDVESSNDVAVNDAGVGEGHVRCGEKARSDRIAGARRVSHIRKPDVRSRNENHHQKEKQECKHHGQGNPGVRSRGIPPWQRWQRREVALESSAASEGSTVFNLDGLARENRNSQSEPARRAF
jgi:hypothetical protein